MTLTSRLAIIARAFCGARGLSVSRVSTLVFNDGKRLGAILSGGDLYTARYEQAMEWFSENWPDGAEWPPEVPRPSSEETLSPDTVPHNETADRSVA